MALFTEESLEQLRQRSDLLALVSPIVELKKSGTSYKGLCPFHEERTASFHLHPDRNFYYCFGCGATGDAIRFLMQYHALDFVDAVERLAAISQVHLDYIEGDSQESWNKRSHAELLEKALAFSRILLLQSKGGEKILDYLSHRSIDRSFIERFELGYLPKGDFLQRHLHSEGVSDEAQAKCGLLTQHQGRSFEFFQERILFPIRDGSGRLLGFSGRAWQQEQQPKYLNSKESPYFQKKQLLFGLHLSKKRMAKVKTAILVEGQIDALKMIDGGFAITVAALGTAYGKEHAELLKRAGVEKLYLLFDGDEAGRNAQKKNGAFFQSLGFEVYCPRLPPGEDPDSALRKEGSDVMITRLRASPEYIRFMLEEEGYFQPDASVGKRSKIIETLAREVDGWREPLLRQEGFKKLASLTQTSEELLQGASYHPPQPMIAKQNSFHLNFVDGFRIAEEELFRWLFSLDQEQATILDLLIKNLTEADFSDPSCKKIFQGVHQAYLQEKTIDTLWLINHSPPLLEESAFRQLFERKINLKLGLDGFLKSLKAILERNWLQRCEELRVELQSGVRSDEEALELAQRFAQLRRLKPEIQR